MPEAEVRDNSPKSVKCLKCHWLCDGVGDLMSHMRDHALRDRRCPHCRARFSSQDDMYVEHIKVDCKRAPKSLSFEARNSAGETLQVSAPFQKMPDSNSCIKKQRSKPTNVSPSKPHDNKVTSSNHLTGQQNSVCPSSGVPDHISAHSSNHGNSSDAQNGSLACKEIQSNYTSTLPSKATIGQKKRWRSEKPKVGSDLEGIADAPKVEFVDKFQPKSKNDLKRTKKNVISEQKLIHHNQPPDENNSKKECCICHKKFKTFLGLDSHTFEVHLSKDHQTSTSEGNTFPTDDRCAVIKQKTKLKCLKCGNVFRDYVHVSEHAESCKINHNCDAVNDEDIIWVCRTCCHGFGTDTDFDSHKTSCNKVTATKKKPKNNSNCFAKFNKYNILNKGGSYKASSYWCHTCGLKFPSQETLNIHYCGSNINDRKSCTFVLDFKCYVCLKMFSKIGEYTRHVEESDCAVKNNATALRSRTSGTSMSTSNSVPASDVISASNSVETVQVDSAGDSGKSERTWKCKCCLKIFSSKTGYENHVEEQYHSSSLSFCFHCGTNFDSPLSYQLHLCSKAPGTAVFQENSTVRLGHTQTYSNEGSSSSLLEQRDDPMTLDGQGSEETNYEIEETECIDTKVDIINFEENGIQNPQSMTESNISASAPASGSNASTSQCLSSPGHRLRAPLTENQKSCQMSSQASSQELGKTKTEIADTSYDNVLERNRNQNVPLASSAFVSATASTQCSSVPYQRCRAVLNGNQSHQTLLPRDSCREQQMTSASEVNHYSHAHNWPQFGYMQYGQACSCADCQNSNHANLLPLSPYFFVNVAETGSVSNYAHARNAPIGVSLQQPANQFHSGFPNRSVPHGSKSERNRSGSFPSQLSSGPPKAGRSELLNVQNRTFTSHPVHPHSQYITVQDYSALNNQLLYHQTAPAIHNSSVMCNNLHFVRCPLPQAPVSSEKTFHEMRRVDSNMSSSSLVSESSEHSTSTTGDFPVITSVVSLPEASAELRIPQRNVQVVFIEDCELSNAYAVVRKTSDEVRSVVRYICKKCWITLYEVNLVVEHLKEEHQVTIADELRVTELLPLNNAS